MSKPYELVTGVSVHPLLFPFYCLTMASIVLMNGIGKALFCQYLATSSPILLAQIISGFISFGALHTKTKGFAPWQW